MGDIVGGGIMTKIHYISHAGVDIITQDIAETIPTIDVFLDNIREKDRVIERYRKFSNKVLSQYGKICHWFILSLILNAILFCVLLNGG